MYIYIYMLMLLREVILACSKTRIMAVVHLLEALCCRLKGREFDSWWCHWNFSLT